jgi:predicted dienelactone hydrolase
MLRKIALGLSALVGVLFLGCAIVYLATNPSQPPEGSVAAELLKPGAFDVGVQEMVFVDTSRPTAANRDYAGDTKRTFNTTLWFPIGADSAHPLVIHSHGLTSARNDLSYVAEQLASHGYVVAAADYPLTYGGAPGRPNSVDVLNQPEDVSFLIDSMLALNGADKPFDGTIDSQRIGLMGYSLGGLTTELATYHPRLRDPRVAAAVSIAGPTVGMTSQFFSTTDVPFLMIAGTLDFLINFDANAAPIPELIPGAQLASIRGGTHLGFAGVADPMFRFMHHPDDLGCQAVLANLDTDLNDTVLLLGGEDDGIVVDVDAPQVCEIRHTEKALHPGEQQIITSIATLAFFESVFAEAAADRAAAKSALNTALNEELANASLADDD